MNRKDQFLSQYPEVTRATYRFAIDDFESITGKDAQFATVDQIIWYLGRISHQAPGTIAKKLAILSSFYQFLTKLGDRLDNPVTPIRRQKPNPLKQLRWLEDDELEKVLKAAQKRGPRELALIWLALHGLRVSELTGLNVNQIRNGVLWNVLGKGNKVRVVPLTTKAQQALSDYIGKRKSGPILLAASGKRLSVRSAQRIVYEVTEASGKRINIHGLRHTYGTRATRRGVPTVTLAKLMGHASVATTEKYVHLTSDDLQIANDLIYPEEEA
jgi:site-specific recombinase XerD